MLTRREPRRKPQRGTPDGRAGLGLGGGCRESERALPEVALSMQSYQEAGDWSGRRGGSRSIARNWQLE